MKKRMSTRKQQVETLELLAAAEGGDAFAQNLLAARLATGYHAKEDQAAALYWYARAVKLGYTYAKWNAATMLMLGEGVDMPHLALARKLAEDAALCGDPSAIRFLLEQATSTDDAGSWHSRLASVNKVIEFGEKIDLEALGVRLTKPEMAVLYYCFLRCKHSTLF